MALHVDALERLEPSAKTGGRFPHSLRDRADLPVVFRIERDDAIGLPQVLGSEDDRIVAVQPRCHLRAALKNPRACGTIERRN